MSKNKFDKHIDPFDSDLDDDYFDAAFELAFDDAFHKAVSTPEDTNPTKNQMMHESWLKVEKQINKMSARKKRNRTLRLSLTIAASVGLGAVLFSVPTDTQAVSPFVQTIKDFGEGIKVFMIKDRTNELPEVDPLTAKTAPPPERDDVHSSQIFTETYADPSLNIGMDSSQALVPVEVTEEEARSGFIGDFILSNAIPERFKDIHFELMLESTSSLRSDNHNRSDHMRVLYSGKDQDGKEELIQFDYTLIHPGQVVEGPLLRETSIIKMKDGSEAFVSIGPRFNAFQWMMGSTNVSLFGTLSEEEMLAIANSMQEQKFPWNKP